MTAGSRRAVIARSEATKQSILPLRGENGLLRGACHRARIRATRWLAMTLIQLHIRLRPRGAKRPRRCSISRPVEGVGNAGCPLHPRSRVHFVAVERTQVTTSTPESPGIPARNGFTAYNALSSATGLVCHRRLRTTVASAPGWADTTSANLTPASGRQEHTTSPYAATSLVRVPLIAHNSSRPDLQLRRIMHAD